MDDLRLKKKDFNLFVLNYFLILCGVWFLIFIYSLPVVLILCIYIIFAVILNRFIEVD